MIGRYYRYLSQKSKQDPEDNYIDGFVMISNISENYLNLHVNESLSLENDDFSEKFKQNVAQQYIDYVNKEKAEQRNSLLGKKENIALAI